jgi:hypothetical protein
MLSLPDLMGRESEIATRLLRPYDGNDISGIEIFVELDHVAVKERQKSTFGVSAGRAGFIFAARVLGEQFDLRQRSLVKETELRQDRHGGYEQQFPNSDTTCTCQTKYLLLQLQVLGQFASVRYEPKIETYLI